MGHRILLFLTFALYSLSNGEIPGVGTTVVLNCDNPPTSFQQYAQCHIQRSKRDTACGDCDSPCSQNDCECDQSTSCNDCESCCDDTPDPEPIPQEGCNSCCGPTDCNTNANPTDDSVETSNVYCPGEPGIDSGPVGDDFRGFIFNPPTKTKRAVSNCGSACSSPCQNQIQPCRDTRTPCSSQCQTDCNRCAGRTCRNSCRSCMSNCEAERDKRTLCQKKCQTSTCQNSCQQRKCGGCTQTCNKGCTKQTSKCTTKCNDVRSKRTQCKSNCNDCKTSNCQKTCTSNSCKSTCQNQCSSGNTCKNSGCIGNKVTPCEQNTVNCNRVRRNGTDEVSSNTTRRCNSCNSCNQGGCQIQSCGQDRCSTARVENRTSVINTNFNQSLQFNQSLTVNSRFDVHNTLSFPVNVHSAPITNIYVNRSGGGGCMLSNCSAGRGGAVSITVNTDIKGSDKPILLPKTGITPINPGLTPPTPPIQVQPQLPPLPIYQQPQPQPIPVIVQQPRPQPIPIVMQQPPPPPQIITYPVQPALPPPQPVYYPQPVPMPMPCPYTQAVQPAAPSPCMLAQQQQRQAYTHTPVYGQSAGYAHMTAYNNAPRYSSPYNVAVAQPLPYYTQQVPAHQVVQMTHTAQNTQNIQQTRPNSTTVATSQLMPLHGSYGPSSTYAAGSSGSGTLSLGNSQIVGALRASSPYPGWNQQSNAMHGMTYGKK